MLAKVDHSYIRGALIDGVGYQEMIGANPWKLGIVAGADSHNAFSDNEEFNYHGVHGNTDKTPKIRLTAGMTVAGEAPKDFGTPGATAVWADENTRAGIFDGIKRKECYGTSGPLIRLRFFGGWGFAAEDADARMPAGIGYAKGVPMGGDLRAATEGKESPSFLVFAIKDIYSGNLDRIQIIKGWMDAKGKTHEKVYDVVWAGDREPGKDGKLPPVGNTVDVKNATWTNTIGAPELITVWKDPDFDPKQHAFYYARIIEIPTPRWTAYEAKRYGIKMPRKVPMVTQERAYTSPIWYTPK